MSIFNLGISQSSIQAVCIYIHFLFVFKDIVIQQDDEIRLKIVGTRVDKNDIVRIIIITIY